MAYTAGDIGKAALLELNVYAPGEVPSAEDAALVLQKLNDLFDEWSAVKPFAYAQVFTNYTLTPNLSPHTIGPAGTFVVTQRPERITSAQLILNSATPNVYTPIDQRDADWWANQALPGLSDAIPTDFYYSAESPEGKIYFWPKPTTAYGVRLETWVILAQAALLTTTLILAPGYRNAITLTLAENIAGTFKAEVSPLLIRNASKARMEIMGNNNTPPRIGTDSPQMSGKGGYNWRTGRNT